MLYSLRSQQRLYKNTNSSRATKTGQLQLISHLNPTEDRPSDAADGSWNRTWVLAKCEKNKKSSIHYRLNTHHSTRSNLHLSDHETQADLLHENNALDKVKDLLKDLAENEPKLDDDPLLGVESFGKGLCFSKPRLSN